MVRVQLSASGLSDEFGRSEVETWRGKVVTELHVDSPRSGCRYISSGMARVLRSPSIHYLATAIAVWEADIAPACANNLLTYRWRLLWPRFRHWNTQTFHLMLVLRNVPAPVPLESGNTIKSIAHPILINQKVTPSFVLSSPTGADFLQWLTYF